MLCGPTFCAYSVNCRPPNTGDRRNQIILSPINVNDVTKKKSIIKRQNWETYVVFWNWLQLARILVLYSVLRVSLLQWPIFFFCFQPKIRFVNQNFISRMPYLGNRIPGWREFQAPERKLWFLWCRFECKSSPEDRMHPVKEIRELIRKE